MTKVRQDAWSHEDDLLLAETVLRHIREGSTQLNAFDEVGDILNRTSAACGFRWNAEVRNKYVQAIELAKRQRKEKKRQEATRGNKQPLTTVPVPLAAQAAASEHTLIIDEEERSGLSMADVIQFLHQYENNQSQTNSIQYELNRKSEENKLLEEQVATLNQELSKTKKRLAMMEEDYQTFIQIMDRARKMTVLEDENLDSPTFRMDKNGNLQQVIERSN
ncbi:MAG TPA: RsfA family transcriptional regulator [Pseudogracilibacillus sp.]|nr:RsfA family transcriptional regulator [Pseudogracilibacillus sp.]